MEDITKGSRYVFADMGRSDAEELFAKAQIVHQIEQLIKKKRLTQEKAAKMLGIDQPKISALLHGKFSGFSIDRLFRFLQALDQDIEIHIRPKPRTRRRARVLIR